MPTSRRDPRRHAWRDRGVLALILLAAGALRFSLAGYGGPHIYHPDEIELLNDAARTFDSLRRGNFSLALNASAWLFLAVVAARAVVGRAAAVYPSWASAELAFLRQDFSFYLWVRRLVAAASLAGVFLTERLARRVFGSSTIALLAAALYGFSLLDLSSAHWVKQDAIVNLCLLVAQLALIELSPQSPRRKWRLAGAVCGLALAARWNTAPVLAGLWFAVRGREDRDGRAWPPVIQLLLFAAMTYLVLTLRPLTWLASWAGQPVLYPTQPYEETLLRRYHEAMTGPVGLLRRMGSNAAFYAAAAGTTMGAPFCALSAVGVVLALGQDGRARRQLALFPVVYLPFLLPVRVREARYLLPLLPYACILTAWVLVGIARRLKGLHPVAGPAAASLVGAWLAAGVAIPSLSYARFLLGHADTRTIAAAWMHAEIPDGSTIAAEKYQELPNLLPPIFESESQCRLKIAASRERGLGSGRIREAWLESYPEHTYRIISLAARPLFGAPWGREVENPYDWSLLRSQGVRYVLLADHAAGERDRSFEARLRHDGKLLARFESAASPAVRPLLAATGGVIDPTMELWSVPASSTGGDGAGYTGRTP